MGWHKKRVAPAKIHDDRSDNSSLDTLTEEMIHDLDEAFKLFDKDGNGAISLDELRTVFETLGRKPTWDIFSGKARKQNQEDEDALREQAKREFDADLLKMMREVDTDNSGSIDSVEFAELIIRKMNEQDDPAILEEAFRLFDQDGSGSITRDEIKEAFRSVIADTGEELPEDEIDYMIKEFDVDGDGTIDFEEFKNYMTQGDEGRQANAINKLAKGFSKSHSRTNLSGAPADAPAPEAPVTINATTRKEKHSICTIQ